MFAPHHGFLGDGEETVVDRASVAILFVLPGHSDRMPYPASVDVPQRPIRS